VPDLQLLQRAPGTIGDLIEILDRRLAEEQRPEERLRMLREATNQITRTANDAIQAYRRARAAVSAELEMPEGDWPHARKMSAQLDLARADVLKALEQTSHRYSWAEPWTKGEVGPARVGSANGGSVPAPASARAQAAVPDR
jgi:delta 1-pyrroline-5-carboxylate dehydrogenase